MSAVSRVLVVGGGIGGLCAAIALRQQGIAVDLIEKAADWTVYGVGIIQPNNTLRALDSIGLAQACIDAGAPFPGWKICNAAGQVLFDAPGSSAAAPAYPPNNGIPRPLLHRILIEAAEREGAHLRLGLTVESLKEHGDTVVVSFSDGAEASYDLVIGNDGLYSDMRKRVFGETLKPRFTGQGVWRYNLQRPAEVEWGALYSGPNTKAGIVPMTKSQMYLLLVTHEPDNPVIPQEALADEMRARMSAYTGDIGAYRDQIVDPAGVVYRPMENLLLASPWHRGRVIIIGDAAHATTPHLAQGAAMAIEDAVLLGDLLGQSRPLAEILDEFMRRRFDRAKFVVESSDQLATWELEEWAGIVNPAANPGALLHTATMTLMATY